MSEDESLLARWSRRKRQAATEASVPAPPESAPPPDAAAGVPPAPELPPIDAIGADSEVSAFLAAGVPTDLTRAALRRAWSADPAIRDFVGLSENSFDFTAAEGVPGFGLITAEDVSRLLQRVIGEPEQPQEEAKVAGEAETPPADSPPAVAEPNPGAAEPLYNVNAALRDETAQAETPPFPPPRKHGGALPD